MLGRRWKRRVLAEIPARPEASPRVGALDHAGLAAFSGLASALAGSEAVLATGPAKADVAIGLATAATAEGGRVAMLEADLANPVLAGRLDLSRSPGLHEFLLGEAEAPGILQSLVLAGPAADGAREPLVCIVAGERGGASAPLLASERCRHAIEMLRAAYDLLVIVGPRLDGSPDALRDLAAQADATIVCGARAEIPKRLPVPFTGLVLSG